MTERIVIGGAAGFMGRRLAAAFRAEGAEVVSIGRSAGEIGWNDAAAIRTAVDGAALVVGLSGKSVDCRYNARNRAEILRSRVETTAALGAAIAASDRPTPLWVNASTATIYRHADDRPQTESTGELGAGFSVGIAKAWEAAFFAAELPATRRVALRTAITLGDGSALVPLLNLARIGVGGAALDGHWPASRRRLAAGTYHRFGVPGGRQRFSWVHLDDVIGVIRFLREHPELDGVVNVSAPNPSDNRTVMATVRRVLGVPFGLPLPRWVLELGAMAIHTETELVLKSRWVVPERLLGAGYEFRYPDLEPALAQIVAARKASTPEYRR